MPTNALRLAIAAAGLSATLLIAGTAEARIVKISVGVSGTQTAHAHVVDHDAVGCANPAGDMSESYSIRTYRRQILVVLQVFHGGLAFSQFQRQAPEILTRGSITRTSNLTADGQVCGGATASCGTRSFARLALMAVPSVSSRGRFQGIGIQNSTNRPRDPFAACAPPQGGVSFMFSTVLTRYNNGRSTFHAPIPASFLKSCRHGSLTRRLDGTLPFHDTVPVEITGATTVHLRVTVKNLGCIT